MATGVARGVVVLHIWIASTVWLMGFSWADGDHDLMMMMVVPDSARPNVYTHCHFNVPG